MASGSSKVVLTAIFGNSLVTAAKYIGWAFTGSASMLAEAIHSTADTANQVLLFVGIQHSKKGPTKLFPFGTGRARYVWNLISAMGIFFIGFGYTTYHGISSLLHPHQQSSSENTFTILMAVLLFAFLVEGYAFWVAYKETRLQKGTRPWLEFLQQSDDPTTVGVLFEDFIAVLGVLVAFICILLSQKMGWASADAIGSLVIGLLMGVMALFLAFVNGRLLIGVSVHSSKEAEIRDFIKQQPSVERVEKIKVMSVGTGQILLALELELHGQSLVNPNQLKEDCQHIANGEEPSRVITKACGRMVRILGSEINRIEKEVKEKYAEILRSKTKTIEEVMNAEEMIRKLQEEIESAEGRLRYLGNQSALSTIMVDIFEPKEYEHEPVVYKDNFWVKLWEGFNNGWSAVTSVVLFFVNIWPVVFVGIFIFWRRKKLFDKIGFK